MGQDLVKIFYALGNGTRLDIVRSINEKKEISCQALLKKFPLSQPTMSHHFRILLDSGIISVRKDGVRHFYKVDVNRLESLGINLSKLQRR